MCSSHSTLCFFLFSLAPLAAQTTVVKAPAFEVQTGFTQLSGGFTGDQRGATTSFMANLNRRVGLVLEASALFNQYGITNVPGLTGADSLDNDIQTLLFGPRVRLLRTNRFTVSSHALFGLGRTRLETPFITNFDQDLSQVPPEYEIRTLRDVGGAMALGGSFDVRISPRFGLVVQADWLRLGRENASSRDEIRITTGVSYRFGGGL